MQIIKNLLYIVSFLCIGNVFAMQNKVPAAIDNKTGIYAFDDGVVCIVNEFKDLEEVTVVIGQIQQLDKEVKLGAVKFYVGPSLQQCFEQIAIKDYKKANIIFSENNESSYLICETETILRTKKVFQLAEENRKKVEKDRVDVKNIFERAKIEIQANMNRNLLFTSVIVSSVLGFVSYIIYKKYKAKQNKTNDLAKTDEVNNEEDNVSALEELKEEIIEKERIV